MITQDDFTRVNNDVNGNPRYVCHFLNLTKDSDRSTDEYTSDLLKGVDTLYNIALKRAKTIGGKKFHNKQYGGGIVFQSYNLQDECNRINELTA